MGDERVETCSVLAVLEAALHLSIYFTLIAILQGRDGFSLVRGVE